MCKLLETDYLVRPATTECRKYVETQDIMWKTHNGGKNHDSPQAVNNHYMRGNTMAHKTQRQQPLVFFFATCGGGYTVEATTSLSLSLRICTRSFYNNTTTTTCKICALSRIYTYTTFRHIYVSVLQIGRNRSGPVL